MRAFIALDIPLQLKNDLAALARDLQGCVEGRFVPWENYHMTLAFLGDVSSAKLPCIHGAMERGIAAIDGRHGIELRANRLGSFGRPDNSTLWMGFEKGPALAQLVAHLRNGLEDCGIPWDGKEFVPHVTLARRVCFPPEGCADVSLPAMARARAVMLYKSELHQTGARYEPLCALPLFIG